MIMSKELEKEFDLCFKRILESRYEDDKINCYIMDLKHRVLLEMASKQTEVEK